MIPVGLAPQVIVGRADVRSSDGVGEVQRQRTAGELDLVVRDRGKVAHVTDGTTYCLLTGYTIRHSVHAGQ